MSTIDSSFIRPAVPTKCSKFEKALANKKVNLSACGSKDNNNFVGLLKCMCKEEKVCGDVLQQYAACHGTKCDGCWELQWKEKL